MTGRFDALGNHNIMSRIIASHVSNNRENWFSLSCILNAAIAATVWLYFASQGFHANEILDGVYTLQAKSLGAGHLYISPGPMEKFYHDVLMFQGRYYFYWGLLPSICLLLLGNLIGWTASHYLIVWTFSFCLVLFFHKIISEIIELASPDKPFHTLFLYILSTLCTWLFIFVLPFPVKSSWFYARFTIYEQQILFGVAIAMPGLYFVITALREKSVPKLALSGFIFSLASWTRITWFPFTLILLSVTLLLMKVWKSDRPISALPKRTILLLAAALILIIGILGLNYFRFGSFFDFGVKYQHPTIYPYLRNLKMFYSPKARLYNTVFNILSYYAPLKIIESLGLVNKSFSFIENFQPSFFYFNPQFIPMLLIVPFGLFKTIKDKKPMWIPLSVFLTVTVYLNLILGFLGTMVILRYFMEFYFFLILTFFSALLIFMRPKWGVPLMGLMIIFYLPGAILSYSHVRPLLRPVEAGIAGQAVKNPRKQGVMKWQTGAITFENSPRSPNYSLIGVSGASGPDLLANDVFAVYMIPSVNTTHANPQVSFLGLRSISDRGIALIFIENRPIGTVRLTTDAAIDCSFPVPFEISGTAPYQILTIFLPKDSAYLTARSPEKYEMAFRELRLETNLSNPSPSFPRPRPLQKN